MIQREYTFVVNVVCQAKTIPEIEKQCKETRDEIDALDGCLVETVKQEGVDSEA